MKEKAVSKMLLILLLVCMLALAFNIHQVKAQDVRLIFRYLEGYDYYPGQTGDLWVTIDIEAPQAWDNTPQGIVGWSFDVHVDPTVLEPVGAYASTFGYYLYDFCDYHGYTEHYPNILVGSIDTTTGDITGVSEFILGHASLGVGAGGNSSLGWYGDDYGLVRLWYNVLQLGDSSFIEITNAHYWTIYGENYSFDYVEIGYYNTPPVPEFPLGPALEILFIPVITYMLWRSKKHAKLRFS